MPSHNSYPFGWWKKIFLNSLFLNQIYVTKALEHEFLHGNGFLKLHNKRLFLKLKLHQVDVLTNQGDVLWAEMLLSGDILSGSRWYAKFISSGCIGLEVGSE